MSDIEAEEITEKRLEEARQRIAVASAEGVGAALKKIGKSFRDGLTRVIVLKPGREKYEVVEGDAPPGRDFVRLTATRRSLTSEAWTVAYPQLLTPTMRLVELPAGFTLAEEKKGSGKIPEEKKESLDEVKGAFLFDQILERPQIAVTSAQDGDCVVRYQVKDARPPATVDIPIVRRDGGRYRTDGGGNIVLFVSGAAWTILGLADHRPAPLATVFAGLDLRRKIEGRPPENVDAGLPAPASCLLVRDIGQRFWNIPVYRVWVNGAGLDRYQAGTRTHAWEEIVTTEGACTVGQNPHWATERCDGREMYLGRNGFEGKPGVDLTPDRTAVGPMRITQFAYNFGMPYGDFFSSNPALMHIPAGKWRGIDVHYTLPVDEWTRVGGPWFSRGHLTLELGNHITHGTSMFRFYYITGFRAPAAGPAYGVERYLVHRQTHAQDAPDDVTLGSIGVLVQAGLTALAQSFRGYARRWR